MDPSLIQRNRPMAAQPPETWNISGGVSGSVPASMVGGLASLQLAFTANSSASLSFNNPITMDEVLYDNFKVKVITTGQCLQRISGRPVALVQGIISAPESWSWSAGTVVKASGTINLPKAGGGHAPAVAGGTGAATTPVPTADTTLGAGSGAGGNSTTTSSNACQTTQSNGISFNVCFNAGNTPVSISETSPSPRFYVVLPIAAQNPAVPAVIPRTSQRSTIDLNVGGQVSDATIRALSPH